MKCQVHIDDVGSDDNGQDLSNYNFQVFLVFETIFFYTIGMTIRFNWFFLARSFDNIFYLFF